MPMSKTDARALVACQEKIQKALDTCLGKLSPDALQYAESYWAAHIKQSIGGDAYGSMPIHTAWEVLNPSREA